MTKRTITPLLAVVALGFGGGVASAERDTRTSKPAAIEPRKLPSGAPACANVLDKDNHPLTRLHPDYPACKPDHPNNDLARKPAHPNHPSRGIAVVFAGLGLDEDGVERPVFEHERR
ncbi:MAG: hypothetical protein H0V17_06730 [Deltaproteobacteria bacterium]|nr:hypothetical protein [Deltaproteobacteria bacterium]